MLLDKLCSDQKKPQLNGAFLIFSVVRITNKINKCGQKHEEFLFFLRIYSINASF